jgi:hypothetical protein
MTSFALDKIAGQLARSTEHATETRVTTGDSEKKMARVQFEVTSKSLNRLTALKEKIEARSFAEVVKNALMIYEIVVREAEKGSQFLVRDKNGQLSPLPLIQGNAVNAVKLD